jgi:type IV secretory pathway VirB2 component (pilin)
MSISHHSVGSLASAMAWAAQLVSGPVATALATFALAGLGFAALSGSLSVTRAMRVLAGLVILFGAPQIAAALFELRGPSSAASTLDEPPSPAAPPPRARSICWTC